MKSSHNVSYGHRAGGHNNVPVYPANSQVKNSHAGKGCLPIIIGLFALLIAGILASALLLIIPWWVESQVEHYTPFNSRALAGTITSAKTEQSNMSQVSLTTTVEGGAQKVDSSFLLRCEEWGLRADILSTPALINTQTHSWYQLTYIEGKQCRDQHGKLQAYMSNRISGSDDSFGINIQKGEGWGLLISAKAITSNFVPVDGKSYQIIVTPNALSLIANH